MLSFSSFLDKCKKLFGLCLLFISVSNFYLAYKASKVINLKSVTVTNVVEVVSAPSNFVAAVSSTNMPLSSAPVLLPPSPPVYTSSVPSSPRQVLETPYQYFVVDRRVGAQMFGRFYYDGSPCSYGRIRSIFPDRIILSSGDWISNKFLEKKGVK